MEDFHDVKSPTVSRVPNASNRGGGDSERLNWSQQRETSMYATRVCPHSFTLIIKNVSVHCLLLHTSERAHTYKLS